MWNYLEITHIYFIHPKNYQERCSPRTVCNNLLHTVAIYSTVCNNLLQNEARMATLCNKKNWPLNSEGYLAYHTYCDTVHPFIMVISEDL